MDRSAGSRWSDGPRSTTDTGRSCSPAASASGKEIVDSRLRIGTLGAGDHHVPEWIDAEYVAQLTGEKAIWKWVKNRGRRELLDLEGHCLAAIYILGPAFVRSLPERAAALSRAGETPTPAAQEPAVLVPRRRGSIDGWRG